MTDGTSNTVIVGESAGKQQVYQLGTAVMPNTPGATGFYQNAAWSDYGTAIKVYGFTAAGTTTGGCSIMNATNAPVEVSFGVYASGTPQILLVPYGWHQFPSRRRVSGIHHDLAAAERAYGFDLGPGRRSHTVHLLGSMTHRRLKTSEKQA